MDVLCSDKTGTLTQNRLTLGTPFAIDGHTPDEVILAGAALASRAENQDPIDLAVLGGLKSRADHGLPGDAFPALRSGPQADRGDGRVGPAAAFKVTKGAPQVILALARQRGGGPAAGRKGGE